MEKRKEHRLLMQLPAKEDGKHEKIRLLPQLQEKNATFEDRRGKVMQKVRRD